MDFISRHMEKPINKAKTMFPAILLTGARQVGKTTLFKEMIKDTAYITLDDPIALQTAIDETGNFFKTTPPPVIVDEIQYAPKLFPYIKMIADNSQKMGMFYLTGSQQFKMMKNVSESLAGRIAILNLLGLSYREIKGINFTLPFIPTTLYFSERKKHSAAFEYKEVWKFIHKGSMPAMYAKDMDWQMFYAAYTKTYIERDVRELSQIGDELKFFKFLTYMAGRTGQMLNLTAVSNEIEVSVPTAERWLSILVASNIVYLLKPYYNNINKRLIKTAKVYFLDTGLAAYLTKWNTPDVLESGAMSGHFFETYVIAEIIKSYYNAGVEAPIYYYRDRDNREIDLLIEDAGTLYPLEIKKTSNPNKEDIKQFSILDKMSGVKRGSGGIICMYDKLMPLQGDDAIIPFGMI